MGRFIAFVMLAILVAGCVVIFREHRDRAVMIGVKLLANDVFTRYPRPVSSDTEHAVRSSVTRDLTRWLIAWLVLSGMVGLFIVPFTSHTEQAPKAGIQAK